MSWDAAPCGLLRLRLDGTVEDANDTFLAWTGRSRGEVVGTARLPELLSVGGRIYWETHLHPLLLVEHRVDEVALELRGPNGRRPVLLTAVRDGDVVHAAVTGASERARYERELLGARRAADVAATRVRALQQATAALSRALGVDGVGGALLAACVEALGARSAVLWLTDGGPLREHGRAGASEDAPVPSGAVVQERSAVEVDGRVVVPLHGTVALHGVLLLTPRTDPAADPLDLEVLTAVGQHGGLALDRAVLYEQSASVARELQHSLLAADPPDDGRYDVATAYRPGVEMLEVGGDWYDVFLAEDGVLSVVVGDVVGRGLAAASAMGQLRSAVRAVAGPGVGPSRLLSRLDRFVEQVEAAGMATIAYAELDLVRGALTWACAGHPPPVLLPAAGTPRLLWDGRSTPLGALLTPEARDQAEVVLAPGDRLLLYTDGLVERRDRALDESLAVLERAAAGLGDLPLADAVSTLTAQLLEDEQVRDDVCVLLLTWRGPVFERELSADLTALSAAREDLRTWLHDQGADPASGEDVVLAASEAVANAAEHGSGGRSQERVVLRARVERRSDGDADVVVHVRDRGRWREPVPREERGRGLRIIRAVVDHLAVRHDDGTTVVLRRRLRGGAR